MKPRPAEPLWHTGLHMVLVVVAVIVSVPAVKDRQWQVPVVAFVVVVAVEVVVLQVIGRRRRRKGPRGTVD